MPSFSPQITERRNPHPVQPLAQARIVHVRPPAIKRGRLAVAGDDHGSCHRSSRAYSGAMRTGSKKLRRSTSSLGQGIDVGNVPLLAPAEFDAERVDQNETPDRARRCGRTFRARSTRRRTSRPMSRLLRSWRVQQVEIEVGEIVERCGTHPGRSEWPKPGWRGAITRQRRASRVEEFLVLREIVAAVQEQQRRAVTGRECLERDASPI